MPYPPPPLLTDLISRVCLIPFLFQTIMSGPFIKINISSLFAQFMCHLTSAQTKAHRTLLSYLRVLYFRILPTSWPLEKQIMRIDLCSLVDVSPSWESTQYWTGYQHMTSYTTAPFLSIQSMQTCVRWYRRWGKNRLRTCNAVYMHNICMKMFMYIVQYACCTHYAYVFKQRHPTLSCVGIRTVHMYKFQLHASLHK